MGCGVRPAHRLGIKLRRWSGAQIQRPAAYARGQNTLSPIIPKFDKKKEADTFVFYFDLFAGAWGLIPEPGP